MCSMHGGGGRGRAVEVGMKGRVDVRKGEREGRKRRAEIKGDPER